VQLEDTQKIVENEFFIARYDDFPVNKGHALVFPKAHVASFFSLTEIVSFYSLMQHTKQVLDAEFSPDGYNIGINEGRAAGQTIDHFHCHLIPRYKGDCADPVGGIRQIFPEKADYFLR